MDIFLVAARFMLESRNADRFTHLRVNAITKFEESPRKVTETFTQNPARGSIGERYTISFRASIRVLLLEMGCSQKNASHN